MTTSRNRRRCGGSTGRRSTPSPAPTSTPRSGSSTPSSASSPPPDAATGQSVDTTAVDLAVLEMAANGTALDAGQASLVRQMCTSGARAAAGDRPGRRREDHRHARPHPGLDPRRRPGARPRPVGCRGRRPRRADRHPHRHPRQTHLVAAARRPAGLGGRGRPVDLGDHRRSRHGRHPLPRHGRPVRHRSRCECPTGR